MTPIWKLALRRILQLAFSITLFVYIIAGVADSHFMAIDRIDILYDAQKRAVATAKSSDPPLTEAEQIVLQTEFAAEAATRYGFDKPFLVRVHMRVVRLVTQGLGEMPYAIEFQVVRPVPGQNRHEISHRVSDMLLNALGPTLLLFLGALAAQVVIAFYLGLWSARRPGSMLDRATTLAAYLGTSVPAIAAAGVVMTLFVYAWRVFPGDIWIYRWPTSWADVGPWLGRFLSYYALPFMTVVILGFGPWAMQFRNITFGMFQEDFVEMARARGIPERRVVYRHVARAASPPLVTAIAMGLAGSMFASFFVEPLFRWPGLGSLFWKAIGVPSDRAGKLVFGIMLVTGVLYVIAVFVLELVYGLLDPRIKVSGKS